MWRVVGVGVGLLHHDGEVEGRMMQFWNFASLAAHAMLRRMTQNDKVTIVFQVRQSGAPVKKVRQISKWL